MLDKPFGVALIVHRDNAVRKIDSSQLSDILRGRAVNWKAPGGRDAPIDLAWRSKGPYNGVAASTRALQNHTYGLARQLTLVTRNLPHGLEKKFIDYALSGDVVDLQVKHAFVPYQE